MGSRAFEGETAADQQAQRPESVLPASATQHLLALQRTAGNHAVARMLAPAAPHTASLTPIPPNPAAAQTVAGNHGTGGVRARKKTREDVEAALRSDSLKPQTEKVAVETLKTEASKKRLKNFDETSAKALPFDEKIAIVLAHSEASYNASLKRGERLLKIVETYAEVIAYAAEGNEGKLRRPKEFAETYAEVIASAAEGKLRQPKELRKEHAAAIKKGFDTTLKRGFYETKVHSITPDLDEEYETIVDVPEKTFTAYYINRPPESSSPHFSEFLWWQYKEALRDRYFDEKGLPRPRPGDKKKYASAEEEYASARKEYREAKSESLAQIWQKTIINPQTLFTMLWCDGAPTGQGEWIKVSPSVEAEREDFCALLGTPNGLSAAHLLVEHGVRFGKRAIDSIEYTTWPASGSTVFVAHMRIHFS